MNIIGIDPGPEMSGYCILETNNKTTLATPGIIQAGKITNLKIREILIENGSKKPYVAIEGMVYQGRGFGKTSIDTCYYIGELREMLGSLGLPLTIYSRREYGQWTTGGSASLNDSSLRASLEQTWGPYAKKTDPLYQLRGDSDKRSAFAIAKYHEYQLFGNKCYDGTSSRTQ